MKRPTPEEPHGWALNITCPSCGHVGDLHETFPCCDHVLALRTRVAMLEAILQDGLDGGTTGMHPGNCKCLWHVDARAILAGKVVLIEMKPGEA